VKTAHMSCQELSKLSRALCVTVVAELRPDDDDVVLADPPHRRHIEQGHRDLITSYMNSGGGGGSGGGAGLAGFFALQDTPSVESFKRRQLTWFVSCYGGTVLAFWCSGVSVMLVVIW
jgi:hypothetical protein